MTAREWAGLMQLLCIAGLLAIVAVIALGVMCTWNEDDPW